MISLISEIRAKHPEMAARADAGNTLAAVRLHCLECCGGQRSEVERCSSPACPLYPFRFGRKPAHARRKLTDEQKAAGAARLALARTRHPGA